MRQYH